METATLLDCGHPVSDGKDANGKKHCYACCAEQDRKQMRETGRITLYLSDDSKAFGTYKVTNWPGSLTFPCHSPRTGRHNIAGKRIDVWFTFEGQDWHGVQYGDNTQICHCKKVK
jgi:hypothetical protein